jgi:AbiV family abortive infection protein
MGKPSKPITQYRGPLSPQQVADGMNAAVRNAKRLLADAQTLYDLKRFPSACSLAILSIEESGKLSILRGIVGATDEETLKSKWRDYRSHQTKNAHWIIAELVTKGARTLDELAPMFDESSDHPAVLDIVKQLGFYTDCYGNAHWAQPDNTVDDELAKEMLFIAANLASKHEISAREIELWIEYVSTQAPTHQSLLEFSKALEREGFSRHSIEEIEAFLGLQKPVRQ